MSVDWYERLEAGGLLDLLAPYTPVIVGAYPLGVAPPGAPVEIACRATDLPAFARAMERSFGDRPGFGVYGGELDGEPAVFAEFDEDGVPVEVSAQAGQVHRRLAAATVGVDRVLDERGPGARTRLSSAVAQGDDWLDAAMTQFTLSRTAIESLAGATPGLVRRVSGLPQHPVPASAYVIPVAVGFAGMLLIALAGELRGSDDLTGIGFMLEGAILGAIFGARLGMVAALVPLAVIALVIGSSTLVGSETCDPDCGTQWVSYLFVGILVASTSGIAGAIRDRYFPRT